MQDTNESLGNFLKKTRDEKNISIEQVAYATRISLKMLRALEDDDHTALPAPTFVRGYLQAYAKYARIDTQDLLLRYQHHLATAPDNKKGAIRSHYLYVRERYQEKRRLVLVIVLFAVMLSVAGTYFLLKAKRERNKRLALQAEEILKNHGPSATHPTETKGVVDSAGTAAEKPDAAEKKSSAEAKSQAPEEKHPAAPATAPETKHAAPTAEAKPVKPTEKKAAPETAKTEKQPTAPAEKAVPATAAAVAANAAPPAVPAAAKNQKKKYNLFLQAKDDVWLRFQTDNDEIRDLTLHAGKALMLRADSVIKIFSGNLGALQAKLNGAPLASLTSESRSKSVVIPATEASKYPLPLFPQFQMKATKPESNATKPKQTKAKAAQQPAASSEATAPAASDTAQ